jgi:hypothetical protein
MVQASQGGLFVTKRSMAVPDCRAPTSTSMRFFGMDLDRTSPSGTHCSATARKLLPADEMIFSRPVNAPPQTNLANTGTIHPSEA